MSMSTSRLIVFLIALNLVIGITLTAYHKPTTFDETTLENSNNLGEDSFGTYIDDETQNTGITNDNLDSDPSVGNPLKIGKIIVNIVSKGMNPLSIHPWQFDTDIEKMIAWTLMLFRSIIGVLLIIQAIIFFKNKGTN